MPPYTNKEHPYAETPYSSCYAQISFFFFFRTGFHPKVGNWNLETPNAEPVTFSTFSMKIFPWIKKRTCRNFHDFWKKLELKFGMCIGRSAENNLRFPFLKIDLQPPRLQKISIIICFAENF
jgi:hypothetical protein